MALLIQEIMLSAIFHVLLGPFQAVVAVALALLGLSGGGLVVMTGRCWQPYGQDWTSPIRKATVLFVVLAAASPIAILGLPEAPGALLYLVALLPFLAGGVCISTLLQSQSARAGALYAADLAGAAAGCLLAIVMMGPLGAPRTMLLAPFPVALVVAGISWRDSGARRAPVLLPIIFLVVEVLLWLGFPLLEVRQFTTSGQVQQARHSRYQAGPDALEFQEWGPDAWTIVRKSGTPQQWDRFGGWGLSPSYQGPVPELKMINYNLRFSTYVTRFDGDFGAIGEWLDSDLVSLQYLLGRRFETVLNVGAGGGREVLNALRHGARRVVALDLSAATIERLMKGRLKEFSGGLYARPEVTALVEEGRSYLARHRQTYDLLDFTIVGGANFTKMELLEVDPLFTQDALDLYLSRLNPSGLFSYVMYSQRSDLVLAANAPETAYLPAVQTLLGLRNVMLERQPGVDFSKHLLVAGLPGVIDPTYDLVHIMASPTPFSAAEVEAFQQTCGRLGFRAWHPRAKGDPHNLYSLVAEGDEERLPLVLTASTDDRPFQVAAGASLWAALRSSRLGEATLALTLLAGLLLSAPLAIGHDSLRSPLPAALFAYFALSGCAFAVLEVCVLLKLRLYLGQPVIALSVGLLAFLLSGALGSALSTGLAPGRIVPASCAVLVWGGLFTLLWPEIMARSLQMDLLWRCLLAVAVVFPFALPMGMFFPLGLTIVSELDRGLIPWAWATSGACSVMGLLGCRALAMLVGFRFCVLVGIGLYLAAGMIVMFRHALVPRQLTVV